MRKVHFVAVCGRATGGIACELARAGWRVTGSDDQAFEPMKGMLRRAGVRVKPTYRASHVPGDAELAVLGTLAGRRNPEVEEILRRDLPHYSYPRFLEEFFLRRSRNLVVAGTNGKTTTTAMLAWILECEGRKPDYLIGGMARDFPRPVRLEGAAECVLEGDEFPCGMADRNPKFIHYRPDVIVVTGVAADHPEAFLEEREVAALFVYLVDCLRPGGTLVLHSADKRTALLAGRCTGTVRKVGFGRTAEVPITGCRPTGSGMAFRLGGVPFEIPQWGRMNVRNAAMAALAAEARGVATGRAAEALARFGGVAGRQEILVDVPQGTVIWDEGYHPQAVAGLIAAVRGQFPGRRVVLVFEPRHSGPKQWPTARRLPGALAGADLVLFCDPVELRTYREACIEPRWLQGELRRRRVVARHVGRAEDLPGALARKARRGDVIVVGLPAKRRGLAESIAREIVSCSLQ